MCNLSSFEIVLCHSVMVYFVKLELCSNDVARSQEIENGLVSINRLQIVDLVMDLVLNKTIISKDLPQKGSCSLWCSCAGRILHIDIVNTEFITAKHNLLK